MHLTQTANASASFERNGARSEKDKEFEIHTLEWMEENRPFESGRSYRLNLIEIIWVKNGSGSLCVDLQKYPICDHTIYCLTPGQFRLFKAKRGLCGYYMALSSEFLHLVESQIDFSFLVPQYGRAWNLPLIRTDEEMQSELEYVVIKMLREFSNYFLLRSEILKGLLKIFIIYLSRKVELQQYERGYDKDAEMLRKFMDLLKKHYTTKKLVADYADALCITPNYLNSIIKKISGFPVSYHIQQYIILEAKRKAFYSGLRMKEIADSLGFDDYAHFSKYFKNYSGMSFSNFKKGINAHA